MVAFFQSIYGDSLALRRELHIPSMKWVIGFVVSFVVVFVYFSILSGPAYRPQFHFVNERGSITVLSGIFLGMGSGFAGAAFFLLPKGFGWSRCFWMLAALGLGFFALDEFLEFHENWGRSIKLAIGRPGTFRNWNDVIVIGYGVVALILGISFFREILRYPRLAEMLMFAFGFYCIHTFIDSYQQRRTALSVILEETAKLYSSSFLAISMFVGLLGVMAMVHSSQRK